MQGALPILVFAVVLAVIVVGWVFGAKAARERREALAVWARSHSWSFDPSEDSIHDDEFPQFEVFRRGSRRRAYNSMRGALEIGSRPFPIKCGDYRYTVSSGKNSTTYRFSYIVLTLPFPNVPGLDIRRENLMDRIAGALGFQDINFESEEFSRRFFVKCSDRRAAYDIISPKVMEFLLASNPPPIRISGGQVCLTDGGGNTTWDVAGFERHLGWAAQFFSLWPADLLDQTGARELRA